MKGKLHNPAVFQSPSWQTALAAKPEHFDKMICSKKSQPGKNLGIQRLAVKSSKDESKKIRTKKEDKYDKIISGRERLLEGK